MPANMIKTYRQPRECQLSHCNQKKKKKKTVTHVETCHTKYDTQVPPVRPVRHVNELHIRVRRCKGTERARGGRVRVGEVAACKSDVGVHVSAAGHLRGRFKYHELGRRAGDLLVAEHWNGDASASRGEREELWRGAPSPKRPSAT